MTINISFGNAVFVTACIGIVQFLLSIWIKARLENSIKAEYDKLIEEYRFELRAKERAEKVAKYLSLYFKDSQNFQELNQLSWELALWLPDHIYLNLTKALKNVGPEMDITKPTILDTLIETRKVLLKKPGSLVGDNIIVHGKDFGKQTPNSDKPKPK
jgi:hypothetical protein